MLLHLARRCERLTYASFGKYFALVGSGPAECFLEMASAHRDVTIIATNFDLGSFLYGAAVRTDPEIHRGLASAMADGLKLDQIISQGQQGCTAGKKLSLEIRPQTITEHGEAKLVDNIGALLDLGPGEELGFVDEYAGERLGGVGGLDVVKNILLGRQSQSLSLETDPRLDLARAGASINGWGEQQGAHTALVIVMAGLEQDRRFSSVHRRVIEIQLRHGK